MEENCKTRGLHSRNITGEAKNVSPEVKGIHTPSKNGEIVSMPICFLVKEQAKSLLALQELQRRMEFVEKVQGDVIDSIGDVWGYLSLNASNSNNTSITLSQDCSKTQQSVKPNVLLNPQSYACLLSLCNENTSQVAGRCCSLKEHIYTENCKKATLDNQVQKFLNVAKSKDSALESDKQDSGLDSDCREQNDAHLSLIKSPKFPKKESGDELLLLLDEINHKSEMLQQQLTITDQKSVVESLEHELFKIQNCNQILHNSVQILTSERDMLKAKLDVAEIKHGELLCHKRELQHKLVAAGDSEEAKVNVPFNLPNHSSYSMHLTESLQRKSKNESSCVRGKAMQRIDSSVVSAILKETNVIELQRQVLIYLTENAVLQAKLNELENTLITKISEFEKTENDLKHEVRLLMIENREMRINLDGYKYQTDVLKSKMVMLEKVFQSVTLENKELNIHLGESLSFQDLQSKNEKLNVSSSFAFASSPTANSVKLSRRLSLPPQVSSQQDANVSCMKSKLLSNTSSFLDVTFEELDEGITSTRHNRIASMNQQSPWFKSSTPLIPFQKLRDKKFSMLVNSPIMRNGSNKPHLAHYFNVKQRLKASNDGEMNSNKIGKKRELMENCKQDHQTMQEQKCNNFSEVHVKLSSTGKTEVTQFENGNTKFPFNTIIEKLKANSDGRLPQKVLSNCGYASNQAKTMHENRSKTLTCGSGSKPSQESNSKQITGNSRNIHQRIQHILDRITAEETN